MDDQSESSNESRSSICCTAQACCAYFLIAFSGMLLLAGMVLAFYLWNYLWLIVSGIGAILLFTGSCTYYSSEDKSKTRLHRKRMKHSPLPVNHLQRPENEDLLPSAPLHNAFSSASQLCLLPSAYFQGGYDDTSIANLPNASQVSQPQNYNQITLNGHNFLLVPLNCDGSVADTTSLVGRQVSQTGPNPSNQESSVVPTATSSIVDSTSNVVQTIIPETQPENLPQTEPEPVQRNTESVCNRNSDFYIPIISENCDNHQISQNEENLIHCSLQNAQCSEHSICLETATSDSNEQNSPSSQSCGSSLDLSSNASTVVHNACANTDVTVPKITFNDTDNQAENCESQNQTRLDHEDNIPSEELRNLGGATGVDTLHPDYVSASDDDSISCGRASPPPSYAEVAREEGFSTTV